MNRRSFIKTIAAATTAPLALLKAKPTIKPVATGGQQSVLFESYGQRPMLGNRMYDDAGRIWQYCEFDANNAQHRIISEIFEARPGRRWMQLRGPRQMRISI